MPAAAHFAPGRYSFGDPTGAIRAHVTKYLGDVTKKDRFAIVPLRTLLALPQSPEDAPESLTDFNDLAVWLAGGGA